MPESRYYVSFPGLEVILTGVKRYPLAGGVPGVQATPTAPAVTPVAPAPVAAAAAPVAAAPVAPVPAGIQPCPPVYTNLCWALRNGMVDASQFDPSQLAALQYACSQLGYTGNCPPPPCVMVYLNANRGRLPMIQVGPGDLAAIPPAPPITDCVNSWTLGGVPSSYIQISGLSGWRGR